MTSSNNPDPKTHVGRERMVSVLRAAADWLPTVTEEKLPVVLKRLEPLVEELARAVAM